MERVKGISKRRSRFKWRGSVAKLRAPGYELVPQVEAEFVKPFVGAMVEVTP